MVNMFLQFSQDQRRTLLKSSEHVKMDTLEILYGLHGLHGEDNYFSIPVSQMV